MFVHEMVTAELHRLKASSIKIISNRRHYISQTRKECGSYWGRGNGKKGAGANYQS